MRKNCPCKGCEERHSLCHDTCDSYKEWQRNKDADNEYLRSFNLPIKRWTRRPPREVTTKKMHISSRPK